MNNRKKLHTSRLVVITGVTGKLGEAYLRSLVRYRNLSCIGVARHNLPNSKRARYLYANLLNKPQVRKAVNSLDLRGFEEVILIHPVGMFKFEMFGFQGIDKNKDGIDDEVFASNVLTFLHIFKALKQKVEKTKGLRFTACAFGSISDKYSIPFWKSYTKSKDFLRKVIQSVALNDKRKLTRGIFVNVSTTDTGNERNLRPHANRKYWLKPEEIVKTSLPLILKKKDIWNELNIHKPNPNFDPTWYTNHENVLKRWEMQMGERKTLHERQ